MTLAAPPKERTGPMPPVLGGLLRGTFFLALKTPLQVAIAFVSIPLVQHYLGDALNGAYVFAWGFGFLQFLLEFGMSSALQRQVSETWTRGDRAGVDRSIACGMNFYAAVTVIQVAALLAVAYVVLPREDYLGEAYRLIVRLLWLQVFAAPFYGLSVVVSSVLQAARRYDFFPRLELLVVVLRFVLLAGGLRAGFDFFWIVAAQTALQVGLLLGPGLWVMYHELGYRPRFAGARWSDYRSLVHISSYMFLIQLSVVLADKIDTTVLGFALPKGERLASITVYQNVSKPFLQIRQTGWTLAYLVMPAVASLAAAKDERSLERVKYDGPRFLVGLLLPVTLLAGLYAGPFLTLWVGPRFAGHAPLLQLFLVGTLPLLISVQVQMAIGIGEIRVVALAALAGSLVNLPLSIVLTRQIGVAGVIWGTVLTTLFSNLLVPGLHVFRVLAVDPRTFLLRTLSAPLAGALALIAATAAFRLALPPWPAWDDGVLGYAASHLADLAGSPRWAVAALLLAMKFGPFLANLAVGCLAYLGAYVATPTGRGDLAMLGRKLGRRLGAG